MRLHLSHTDDIRATPMTVPGSKSNAAESDSFSRTFGIVGGQEEDDMEVGESRARDS